LLLFVGLSYGGFKLAAHRFDMNRIPADLEVQRIIYSKQERWGTPLLALPGDNETGLLVYGIPVSVREDYRGRRRILQRPREPRPPLDNGGRFSPTRDSASTTPPDRRRRNGALTAAEVQAEKV
jgi:hypothetical protein